MDPRILAPLLAVRRRMRMQTALRHGTLGLLLSTLAAIFYTAWGLWAAEPAGWPFTVALLIAGPIAGMLVGLSLPHSLESAARVIDRHYGLKDRGVTALEFTQQPADSTFHALQLAEAAKHFERVSAVAVIPTTPPRFLPYSAAALVVALVLLVWPRGPQPVEASPAEPLPGVVAAADELVEDLKQLQEAAQEQEHPGLDPLLEELLKKAVAMKEPDVDVREALATISDIQAAMAAELAEYNDTLVDSQLESLGEAMMAATPLAAAGQALKQGKFDKASDELEAVEKVELEKREAKDAAKKMQKVAKSMQNAGMGQMSGAVSESADGIAGGQGKKTSKGLRRMARLVHRHHVRKNINSLLARQIANCSECKSICRGAGQACATCGGSCQAGQCQGNKNSLAKGKAPKSDNPSTNWGMGHHGGLDGARTELASTRNVKEITGQAGEGPSEIESSTSPEGREQARRGYREVYHDYKKMSDAVLESEPIPLGHRQTIRRYFELIRPQTAAASEPEAAGEANGATTEE